MTTLKSVLIPIQITPGVQPSTDKTAFATPHYTQADKIRFRFGFPQKLGGWQSILFSYGNIIMGFARSLFSGVFSSVIDTLVGTNTNLYSVIGSQLTNITPLQAATTHIPNSVTTYFGALASNPIFTYQGLTSFFVYDNNAPHYLPGDFVTIAGASGVDGLTAGDINKPHIIESGILTFGYNVSNPGGAAAISGGIFGGGASVKAATGLVTFAAASNGITTGQRVKIAGVTAAGGLTALQINGEFISRDAVTGTFDVMTGGTATSMVTAAGGSGTTYQTQLLSGNADQSIGQGYGMGLYGQGLYGIALLATGNTFSFPRIWFFDRFGSDAIMTAGNQTGLYSWTGDDTIAPALVSGAPTAINYAFVSNNIVVTFGAGGTPNRILTSDQGNMTQWTASSSNQVFDDTVQGAEGLVSHLPVNGVNLIFTAHQTYLFAYLGFTAGTANAIWSIQLLDVNVGIIASMARATVAGIAYWMDQNNFYRWAGANVQIIPANSQNQSTILNYVFQNINRGQQAKCFAWYNEQFDEIWFHYPSAGSNEPDSVARYSVLDQVWTPDTFDRLCAEYPSLAFGYPRLINSTGTMYAHEQGADADGQPMPWSLTTNLRGGDFVRNSFGAMTTKNYMLTGVVPDSVQSGDINLEVIGQRFPQSGAPMFENNYTINAQTEFVTTQGGARLWRHRLSGNEKGQEWTGGQWHEYVQESSQQ